MRYQQLVFCQLHSSRTSYHASTDWLQYRINLVTTVLVDFQKKKISLSTIGLTLKTFSRSVIAPGMQNGAFSVLFLIFVMEIDSITETQ